jgi:hypothetical protein
MERLTFDGNFCDIAQCRNVPGGSFCEDGACSQKKVWTRLKSYEDTGMTPKEVTALGNLFDYALKQSKTLTEQLTLLKHIRELAEADKEGRLVVLPCKVGDTVYRLQYIEQTPGHFTVGVAPIEFMLIWLEDIGETIFLTREDAEKALAEME